jgi:hypothetical protein
MSNLPSKRGRENDESQRNSNNNNNKRGRVVITIDSDSDSDSDTVPLETRSQQRADRTVQEEPSPPKKKRNELHLSPEESDEVEFQRSDEDDEMDIDPVEGSDDDSEKEYREEPPQAQDMDDPSWLAILEARDYIDSMDSDRDSTSSGPDIDDVMYAEELNMKQFRRRSHSTQHSFSQLSLEE